MSIKYLSRLLTSDTDTVFNHMNNMIKRSYGEIHTDNETYVYAVGENPMCLVAHVDTVRIPNKDEPVVLTRPSKNIIRNKNGVLGADDRAGCFAISYIVKACQKYDISKPSIIITDLEETGGWGMTEFIDSNKIVKNSINLIIALDRYGKKQYVYYVPINSKVKKYVESFDFVESKGIFSDILFLSIETRIPSVNLSIGYHRPHSQMETLRLDHMSSTINKVINMLKNPIEKCHYIPQNVTTRENSIQKLMRKVWLEKIRESNLKESLLLSEKEHVVL